MKQKILKTLVPAGTICSLAPTIALTSCGAAYQIYVDKPEGCLVQATKSYVKELDGFKGFYVDFKNSTIDTGLESVEYSSNPSDQSQGFPLSGNYGDFYNYGDTCTARVNMTYLQEDKADVVALRYTFI